MEGIKGVPKGCKIPEIKGDTKDNLHSSDKQTTMSAPLTPEGDKPQYLMYDIAIAFLNNNLTISEYDQKAVEFLDAYATQHTASKDERIKDLVSFINVLKVSMAEQFARHDYRAMWEIWLMLIDKVRLDKIEDKDERINNLELESRNMAAQLGEDMLLIKAQRTDINLKDERIKELEEEPTFCVVYRDIDTGKELKTDPYTAKELLLTMEDDVFENAIKCDCQPIGETNFVECNCQAPYDNYVFNRVEFIRPIEIAELENKYNKSCEDRDNSDGWATEMKRQRDQAFDLLEVYQKATLERLIVPTQTIQDSITLLSSRENKNP